MCLGGRGDARVHNLAVGPLPDRTGVLGKRFQVHQPDQALRGAPDHPGARWIDVGVAPIPVEREEAIGDVAEHQGEAPLGRAEREGGVVANERELGCWRPGCADRMA